MEASGDVTIDIIIKGERPKTLTLFKSLHGKNTSETIAVPSGDGPVTYTFRDVSQSFDFWLHGGDFTSPLHQIEVPQKVSLVRMHATYHYPTAYAGLAAREIVSPTGDLEALQGTTAEVTYSFDQPVDAVDLVSTKSPVQSLKQSGPKEFDTSSWSEWRVTI